MNRFCYVNNTVNNSCINVSIFVSPRKFLRKNIGRLNVQNVYLMISLVCSHFSPFFAFSVPSLKVTIFLCSGWLIILITVFPIYLMLMISDDRNVMAVCWFRPIDIRMEMSSTFDKDYYWFEVQILLTTLLTIFLPISLIVACNIRVLTIGKLNWLFFFFFIHLLRQVLGRVREIPTANTTKKIPFLS